MNFKEMLEQRNDAVEAVNGIFAAAEAEKRTLNDAEVAAFEARKADIERLDRDMRMHEEARNFAAAEGAETRAAAGESRFAVESRAFTEYLRAGKLEARSGEMAFGTNGAVIPSTIMNKILETVSNLCPIYSLATKYNVAGTISFPVYDETDDAITVAYAQEFQALASHSGKFTSVSLGGYLTGALCKISRSLINNAQFDIVSYVITQVSKKVAQFLEKELLTGSGSSTMGGVLTQSKNTVAAAKGALTVDNLIDLQLAVAQQYQADCVWIMSTKTLGLIRKLKDTTGALMLNKDVTQGYGWSLLGKPIYLSDNMPEVGTSTKSVIYGDLSGLYVNIRPGTEMQVLNEQFAVEHATGVVVWGEYDSKLCEEQKIAVLKHAAS